MSSEVKVDKIWPRLFTTSFIEMRDGEVRIFPRLRCDHISEFTPGHGVIIDGLELDLSIYVDTIHDQTIGGIKTFTVIPVLPSTNPTNANHAVRKGYVDGLVGDVAETGAVPVGSILSWGGDWHYPPAGYLLCNGDSYSISQYPNLYATIQYWFGREVIGGGQPDKFRVPDLRTRVPAGLKPADSNFGTLGRSGGAATHQLSESEMPTHGHETDGIKASGGQGHKQGGGSDVGPYANFSGFSALAHSKGQGTPHNNLPPYLVINYIIKY